MSALNESHIRILSYMEQVFWETGFVPTNEKIAEDLKIPLNKLVRSYDNPDFKQAAAARGLDLEPDKSSKALEPRQVLLANMMMNILDKQTLREKLKQIGVSPQTYQAWRRQPAFQNYLKKRAEQIFNDSDTEAYLGLAKAVQSGDLNAIKFHMEVRGVYNPRVQVDINIEQVLVRVVDIVAKFVEPSVLEQIGNELDSVLGSNNASPFEIPQTSSAFPDIGEIDI